MKIFYVLHDKDIDPYRKLLCERIVELVSDKIKLPDSLQIEFKKLDENVYGETSLNPRYNNRITLNYNLEPQEFMRPLVHELCHINQILENRLSKNLDGSYVYCGKKYHVKTWLEYNDYLNLPWELDARITEKMLLKHILEKLGKLTVEKG